MTNTNEFYYVKSLISDLETPHTMMLFFRINIEKNRFEDVGAKVIADTDSNILSLGDSWNSWKAFFNKQHETRGGNTTLSGLEMQVVDEMLRISTYHSDDLIEEWVKSIVRHKEEVMRSRMEFRISKAIGRDIKVDIKVEKVVGLEDDFIPKNMLDSDNLVFKDKADKRTLIQAVPILSPTRGKALSELEKGDVIIVKILKTAELSPFLDVLHITKQELEDDHILRPALVTFLEPVGNQHRVGIYHIQNIYSDIVDTSILKVKIESSQAYSSYYQLKSRKTAKKIDFSSESNSKNYIIIYLLVAVLVVVLVLFGFL